MRRPSGANVLGLAIAGLAGVLLAVCAINVARLRSKQETAVPAPAGEWNADSLAARLAGAVRYRTLSGADSTEFLAFHAFLFQRYPRVFRELARVRDAGGLRVPEEAILLHWPGTSPGLEPVLLLAHLDVVPVEPGTEEAWDHPPFAGHVDGGYVWGRGTMDDKGSVIMILEAVESLLAAGFTPERGIYLGFGHDEETVGEGARAMAGVLAERGVRLVFVLDEGLAVTHGILPGVEAPVALVGIAEKGSASVELTVETEGGHSSMPPPRTAPGLLAEAAASLETHRPAPRLDGPTRLLFQFLAPEMRFPFRVVFANMGFFEPFLIRRLASAPGTDAAIRTSTAVTLLESGIKENVLPSRARAVVNYRIRPGETAAGVLAFARSRVDTSRVAVTLLPGARDPSPVSDPGAESFRRVARAIRSVFPDAVVAPGLVLGGTDSRHFTGISRAVYRFAPLHIRGEDTARLHGTDERLPVESLPEMARFYRRLIESSATAF